MKGVRNEVFLGELSSCGSSLKNTSLLWFYRNDIQKGNGDISIYCYGSFRKGP